MPGSPCRMWAGQELVELVECSEAAYDEDQHPCSIREQIVSDLSMGRDRRLNDSNKSKDL